MSVPLPHPYPRPDRPQAVALISPIELQQALNGPEPPILIDVRPGGERRFARFPNDRHVPLAELPQRREELRRAGPIVVYCQYGSLARRAAEYLQRDAGATVAALEGGIDEYARIVDPSIPRYEATTRAGELVVRQFPRVESGCLAYLVGDPGSRTATVIDPGRDVTPYVQALSGAGWKLAAIVETHTHADHLAGHHDLNHRTDAPIYLGRHSPAQFPHRPLADGEALSFGSEEIVALETPGHTRDHITLRVRDKLFTGDTLLIGSCGRTDLGDGSPELLWESLREKLLVLPDDTEVLPAHYGRRHALVDRYVSSLGFEKATNEALGQESREAFLRYMSDGWPPKPTDFDRIVAENLR